MGKGKKKRNNQKKLIARLVFVLLIAIIALIAVIIWKGHGKTEGKKEKAEEGMTFPYELEEGKLTIDSLFQFTGTNPDCEDEEGENIAALSVTNQSEQQLASANIEVQLASGTKLEFEIADIPAGQTCMVFEKNNTSYETADKCKSIDGAGKFDENAALMEDEIDISVKETTITLTNKTEKDLENLLLHCHCLVEDTYFGGLTYSYPVEKLSAGESVEVQAEECYLGEASVVRVSQDDGEE